MIGGRKYGFELRFAEMMQSREIGKVVGKEVGIVWSVLTRMEVGG